MKNQTLSIEQMKHLKDLGVDVSKASMCWWLPMERLRSKEGYLLDAYEPYAKEPMSDDPIIMAFTLQDILELLPNFISKDGYIYDLMSDMHNSMAYKIDWNELEDGSCIGGDDLYLHTESDGSNLLKMAYKMLCWIAKNNYLNKEEQ